ncbi:MAG: lipocalin-like domain-containing protein [Syntrophobacteraceae bacterium]
MSVYPRMPSGTGILILIAVLISCLPGATSATDYTAVTGPCSLSFPADHASHPDYRTEWWYYTGNLVSDEGRRYGFQLTFFRFRTMPASTADGQAKGSSAWRTSQIYAAHAAISDISSGTFHHSEKLSRTALDLAGTREQDGRVEVFLTQWRATITPEFHNLTAGEPGFSFSLDLYPEKPPVAHGESGYSKKGEDAGEAGCYYSITRFKATGNVTIDGREHRVHGTAWMDHEFSSAPMNPDVAGWDWFSLQFSDGSDLMLYLMRKKSGEHSAVSNGTFVGEDGKPVYLSVDDFHVKVLNNWKSPRSGAVYPASWLLEIPLLGLRVTIVPNMADQEMQTPLSTRITYWEGSVKAEGTGKEGVPVTGAGYIELTGYAGPAEF